MLTDFKLFYIAVGILGSTTEVFTLPVALLFHFIYLSKKNPKNQR